MRTRRFAAERELAGLDEPVRRYFTHALTEGAALPDELRLTMRGRIDVGVPLSFSAEQSFTGHSFVWSARAGVGPVRPLHVVDRYDARGHGSTDGRLFGRLRFLHAEGADVARAAAGRAAAEVVWRPWLLLPSLGVDWRVVDDRSIAARFRAEPEDVELTLHIDAAGALTQLHLLRWGDVGREGFGYIPFGGDALAEARFGGWRLPSRLQVGWWFGTPQYKPFFDGTVLSAR